MELKQAPRSAQCTQTNFNCQSKSPNKVYLQLTQMEALLSLMKRSNISCCSNKAKFQNSYWGDMKGDTLPETNIAPKNGWLEYYFPIGARPIFRGYVMLVSGSRVSIHNFQNGTAGSPILRHESSLLQVPQSQRPIRHGSGDRPEIRWEAPVEGQVVEIYHYLQGFLHSRCWLRISEPSTVPNGLVFVNIQTVGGWEWDFSHQQ